MVERLSQEDCGGSHIPAAHSCAHTCPWEVICDEPGSGEGEEGVELGGVSMSRQGGTVWTFVELPNSLSHEDWTHSASRPESCLG